MWGRLKAWWHNIDLGKTVQAVQLATLNSCNYLPMATSVAAVILAGNPAVVTAASVSSAICAALKKAKAAGTLLGGAPMPIEVEGVIIEGDFVK